MNQTPNCPKLSSLTREIPQAQPIHPYNLLIVYNGYITQVKAQDISHANENSVLWHLDWALETAPPSLLWKIPRASVTTIGYGLPFNSHTESTNLPSNKQIHLAWIEIHTVLLHTFEQPCCSTEQQRWKLSTPFCWAVHAAMFHWCLQKAFISRHATYVYYILQNSACNLQQALYLRVT